MRYFSFIVFFLLIFIAACQPRLKKPIVSVNGIWESVGSGWLLSIEDSLVYSFYDITSVSCLPRREGSFEELRQSLSLNHDTLIVQKGVIDYSFTRKDNLPELCSKPIEAKKNRDPIYNFEVFAETVKEHYAFFELNDLNWEEIYQQQKGKLSSRSTEAELYQVLEETLEILNDNHAFLEATDEVYEALEQLAEQEQTIASEELPEIGDFQVAKMVAQHHMQEEMTQDSWLIEWGKLTDAIGFMQVKAMWLYADLDIPKQLIEELGFVDAYVETFHKMYEGDYIEKEMMGVSKIMDRVMKDLAEMEAIVIDVRFNGGGQDAVSFEILSRFIPAKEVQVASQKIRYGNTHTPVLPLYINGRQHAFTKPVYVLSSPQTGSAAEAFAISTMAMDHVQRIGSASSGAMSTALEKTLPNGWAFAISNEVYMDNDGNCYENIGVPVDYELQYSRDRQTFFRSVVNDLEADKQAILKAIEALNQN